MSRALLVGRPPERDLGYSYPAQPPYDAVVIGSLTLGQLLYFRCEPVLEALAAGKTVVLYTPGLPEVPKNRAMSACIAARKRELQSWGVRFVSGTQKQLVTAAQAKLLRAAGKHPEPGAVLTPLAREILEGMT